MFSSTFCLLLIITQVCGFRIPESTMIIRNVSVPCSELDVDPYGSPVIHFELNDAEKIEILQQDGGEYANSFLAKTRKEADHLLPSLVALDSETKETIMTSMQQMNTYAFSKVHDNWISRGLIREYLIKTHPDHKSRETRSLDSVETKSDHTLVLPEDVGLNDTYEAPFGVDRLDYCLIRGAPFVDQLHLRMCTVCNSLREMEDSIWPRYINEAVCSPHDSSCLLVQGIPLGSCRENVMPIHVLKKQANSCVLQLINGQSIVLDHWSKETIMIRVGCECAVKSQSWLSSSVEN